MAQGAEIRERETRLTWRPNIPYFPFGERRLHEAANSNGEQAYRNAIAVAPERPPRVNNGNAHTEHNWSAVARRADLAATSPPMPGRQWQLRTRVKGQASISSCLRIMAHLSMESGDIVYTLWLAVAP